MAKIGLPTIHPGEFMAETLTENSGFKDMAKTTVSVAATEFGRNSKEHKAVKAAWKAVGLLGGLALGQATSRRNGGRFDRK